MHNNSAKIVSCILLLSFLNLYLGFWGVLFFLLYLFLVDVIHRPSQYLYHHLISLSKQLHTRMCGYIAMITSRPQSHSLLAEVFLALLESRQGHPKVDAMSAEGHIAAVHLG